MPNPNVFTYVVQEKQFFADPLTVRRVLLDHTLGKCWGIIRKLNQLRVEIIEARSKADACEEDLRTTPTSPEELEKIAEMQKLAAEGKQHTTRFEDMPRVYKLDGYNNKVAILSKQVVELEDLLTTGGRAAFDLPPIDPGTGDGVTELEVLEIVRQFVEYAEGKGERLGG